MSPYIFWTVTTGIFIALLVGMGLDYLTFKVVIKDPDTLIKSYLFKASLRSSSTVVAVVSWAVMAAFIYLLWRYGSFLKKMVSSFGMSPGILDEITYKSIAVGFPVFTMGGLIFGAIWADQAWGVYWSWDPKETWSLITWFVYAFYLHARLLRGWKGKKIAMVAVIGHCYIQYPVNLLLSGPQLRV